MIITLTGNNHFLIQAELRRLVNEFVAKYTDMGLQRIDGEEADYEQIREALESLPFLASKKMVVLRSPGANKKFVEAGEQLLENLPEMTDVIIHEPKLDKRSVYYKYLKKHTDYKELNDLDEQGLASWLVTQASVQGSTLYSKEAMYLIERVGVNQQLLSNELTKLAAYGPNITKESIDLLTEPTPQSTVFQLLDAAFAGDGKKTLAIYQEQRAGKLEPQALIAMLTWQFHVVAVVKAAGKRSDADIAAETKISPFVIRKSKQISNNLTTSRLKLLLSQLLQLDIKTKTTTLDADDALQAFLLHIAY